MARKETAAGLVMFREGVASSDAVQHTGEPPMPLKKPRGLRKIRRSAKAKQNFPLTPEKTSEFFNHISNNSKVNAKKIISEFNSIRKKSEWSRGYFSALTGMINSLGNNGTHLPFLMKVQEHDGKGLRLVRKEFTERIEKPFASDYDCGFFTAWIQYLSVLALYS